MIIATIEIQKTRKGWGCCTVVEYPGWPHPAKTHEGFDTLKSALWHFVLDCIDYDWAIESVTVKGENMPLAEVCEIVEKALRDGVLKYRLPGVREALRPKGA